jgi:hypothetical protein
MIGPDLTGIVPAALEFPAISQVSLRTASTGEVMS